MDESMNWSALLDALVDVLPRQAARGGWWAAACVMCCWAYLSAT